MKVWDYLFSIEFLMYLVVVCVLCIAVVIGLAL